MPRPQSFRRIIIEDYPEKDRSLVGKMAYSINSFADDVLQCLSNNLSIRDNLAAEQKTITTITALGVPTKPLLVKTGLLTNCGGTQVIMAINKTNKANVPTSCPFITFTNNAGSIIISNISGLQDDEEYELTVIFWPA